MFEAQLVQKGQATLRIFQELIKLEFDKVVSSIQHKEDASRRKQINGLIADVLSKNDA